MEKFLLGTGLLVPCVSTLCLSNFIRFDRSLRPSYLHILNILLRRREDGSLDVSVYMKPTHTYRYLHFESHYLTHVKRGVVRCLHDRAWGSLTCRTTFRRKLTTLLESSSRMVTLWTWFAMPLPHPHRKQQTQAVYMRDRRRRRDYWWWYPMWLGWVKTSGMFGGSSISEYSVCSLSSPGGLFAEGEEYTTTVYKG